MNIQKKDLSKQALAFYEACYDMNSIEELKEPADYSTVDPYDLEEWGITADEWIAAIKLALQERIEDLEEDLENELTRR